MKKLLLECINVGGEYSGRRDTPPRLGGSLRLLVGGHTVIFKLCGRQSKPPPVNLREGEMAKLINMPVEQSRIRCPLSLVG